MNRNDFLLAQIDLQRHEGLEFGALCNPIVPPDTPGISYVDHLDTDGLKDKYRHDPNVDIERIVPVRYIWSGGPLLETVGPKRFDYAVASHMAEHSPDLIGWLRSVARILNPGGILALALPDMRYCFDCRRNLTTIAELLEAYLHQYRRPSIRQILDFLINKAEVPEQCAIASLWEDPAQASRVALSNPKLLHNLDEAGLRGHFEAIKAGEYIDSHCSVLTPASFLQLLSQIAVLDLLDFSVKAFRDTRRNEQEFLVILEKLPESVAQDRSRKERLSYILERIPDLPAAPAKPAARWNLPWWR